MIYQPFKELYALYFPGIYAYINYRVSRVQDAEDLVASTFLKASERLGQFEWRGNGSFAAWFFRIAHDLVIDSYRRPDHGTVEEVDFLGNPAVWIEGHSLLWENNGISYEVGGLDLDIQQVMSIAQSMR